MTTVTITLTDEENGALTMHGESSDKEKACRANIIAQYVAVNFQTIHDEALKDFARQCDAMADEGDVVGAANAVEFGSTGSMGLVDKHGQPYPTLNPDAAHKGDDGECEVCQ